MEPSIEIVNTTGQEYLKTISPNSVDLVLTDPPYIISRESGMNTHYNNVAENKKKGVEFVKTEEDWIAYKTKHDIKEDKKGKKKDNYLRYGTMLGKKYCKKTDFGSWDADFTIEQLDEFVGAYYNKLRKGGTIIIFFDIWKITTLKDIMEKHKFKQIRFIEWIKTNPQPLNSSTNYLTNCREIALLGVKGGKPTFNSKYDNALYQYPMAGGKNRVHPTQKNLLFFEDLIKKHSNEGDLVLDTFLGGGTTAIACKNTNRVFKGCEISKKYYDKILEIMKE
uniref:DNA methylase N-4/N-6 domain-containing protein n=1 Tax=viral metagenome TaxID=1070528 RepID=A0A6C0BYF7_9ZZZZ